MRMQNRRPRNRRMFSGHGRRLMAIASVLGVTAGCVGGPAANTLSQRVTISGRVLDPAGRGVAGVVVSATGVVDASLTNASGAYSLLVPVKWSGVIRPDKSALAFTPPEIRLSDVTTNLSDNDFAASLASECAEPTSTATSTNPFGPKAEAGPSQLVDLPSGASKANVRLDGAGSQAPDGSTFEWRVAGGDALGTGERISVELPEGVHMIQLVVTTPDGARASDEVLIRVASGGVGTLWVDVNNPAASSRGPGAPASPFDSIDAAISAAKPGDTIVVRAGTYRRHHPSVNRRAVLTQNVHGTAELPITIKADLGADVLLTGDYPGGELGSTGWEIIDSSHLNIRGFRFDNFTGPGLDIGASSPGGAHHITVENCSATRCSLGTNTFVAALRATGPAQYITFRKCMVHDCNSGIVLREGPVQTRQTCAVPPRAGNSAPGTPSCGYPQDMPESQWNIWPGWNVVAPSHCVIEDCLLYDNSRVPEHSDGIGTRYTVDCVVRNNVAFRNADDNYDMLGATRMTFTGNIAFAADPNDLADADGNGIKIGVRGGLDCLVANNISFDNDRMGIDMGDTERGRVYHNTLVNNGANHPNGFGLWFEGGRSATGHQVMFNIIRDNGRNTSRGDYGVDRHVAMAMTDGNSVSDSNSHNFAAPAGPHDRFNDSGMFPNEGMSIDTAFDAGMSIDQRLEKIRSQVRRKFTLAGGSPLRGAVFVIQGVNNDVTSAGRSWGAVQD
ncbi:MAG: right-handed parallel beta-helix repeat-containing protein [Phycisphaerales bacterium]|nr:right-handed parallel beta-helix repeat-containing protein [Phycisphaerales bacterium]